MTITEILEQKVDPLWMVLTRHFGMPGGLLDYGVGNIEEFFTSFEKADQYAKKLFLNNYQNEVMPKVWVLRCEKTYQKAKEGLACAVTKGAEV